MARRWNALDGSSDVSESPQQREPGVYARIVQRVFMAHYEEGAEEVLFYRDEIQTTSQEMGLQAPRNLGDVIYTFRFRRQLPPSIQSTAPRDKSWIVQLAELRAGPVIVL